VQPDRSRTRALSTSPRLCWARRVREAGLVHGQGGLSTARGAWPLPSIAPAVKAQDGGSWLVFLRDDDSEELSSHPMGKSGRPGFCFALASPCHQPNPNPVCRRPGGGEDEEGTCDGRAGCGSPRFCVLFLCNLTSRTSGGWMYGTVAILACLQSVRFVLSMPFPCAALETLSLPPFSPRPCEMYCPAANSCVLGAPEIAVLCQR
jgi:hypothetical protein